VSGSHDTHDKSSDTSADARENCGGGRRRRRCRRGKRRKRFRRKLKLLAIILLAALLIIALFGLDGTDCGDTDDPATPENTSVTVNSELPGTSGGDVVAHDGDVELIVNLEDDRDDAEETLEQKFGFDLKLNSIYSDDANLFVVRVAANEAETILDDISDDDGVEYAEVNGTMEAYGYVPNDPLYMFQWNFEQINSEDAWSTATGDEVVVAVIDTGVAYEEGRSGRKEGAAMPDLGGTTMADGYDFVDDDDKAWDQHGHGTHVAGTVAQTTDNDYGVAGLAFGAAIMPLRVLDARGRGNFADVADAIRFAADNGADVVNLSLGSFVPSREVESAVREAYEAGTVVVAAAGNSGTRIKSYPAAFDHVIAVAATQYDESTTFYSNYGSYIDVAAPGGNTLVDQNDDGRPDGVMQETLTRHKDGRTEMKPTFALYMGTSMASPHVAAAAALLIEQGVSHPDEVERLLKESARNPNGSDEWDERYGHGIIDVEAALQEHATDSGLWRIGAAFALALLALFRIRRRDSLAPRRAGASFWTGWTLRAGALFLVPFFFGESGLFGGVLALLGQPFMNWDTILFGPGSTNALFASALPVFALVALLLGSGRGRRFASGFGLATGGVLLVEAIRQTVDVGWIPGIGMLDQAWLVLNGLAAIVLGYLALKRR